MARAGLFANAGSVVREAASAGLRRLGYEIVYQVPGAWQVSQAERGLDAVVVYGIRGRCGEVAAYYSKDGVPVAMVDLPHWRGLGEAQQLRVTPPSHVWLPTFDGDPPLDRLERLGVELQSRKRVKGQSVLLVGQKSGDTSHGMDGGAFRRWAAATLATIRSLTDSKVLWRPHPEDRWSLEGVDAESDPTVEDLAAALDRSWLVVTYNSTAGLEALVAGLPVIAEGPAVYQDLAVRLNQFSKAVPADPDQLRDLLARISYTQWTPEEIASGLPLDVALRNLTLKGRQPDDGKEEAGPTVSLQPEVVLEPPAPENAAAGTLIAVDTERKEVEIHG